MSVLKVTRHERFRLDLFNTPSLNFFLYPEYSGAHSRVATLIQPSFQKKIKHSAFLLKSLIDIFALS